MRRIVRALSFLGFFSIELVRANLQVAREVITPRHTMQPAIIPMRVQVESDLEVSLLMGLLALTPGSLPVDLDRENRILVIHLVHSPSAEASRRQVSRLERRLLEVVR